MRDVYYRDRNDSMLLGWALGIIAAVAILTAIFLVMNREPEVDVTSVETAPVEEIETLPPPPPEPTIIERPVIQEVPVVVPVEKPVVIEKPVIQEVPVPSSQPAAEAEPAEPVGAGTAR